MSGVSEIDQQHMMLVGTFNRLNEAVRSNESREDIYQIIDGVISN